MKENKNIPKSFRELNGDKHLLAFGLRNEERHTDKRNSKEAVYANVLEFEQPELIVCYRETDHFVKDICIDTSDGSEASSSSSSNNAKILVQESLGNSSLEFCNLNTKTDASKEETYRLPIQTFGTRSFLRSFLDSLDAQGKTLSQPLQLISSGTSSDFNYNSKVETGSITFDFNESVDKDSILELDREEEEETLEKGLHDHKELSIDAGELSFSAVSLGNYSPIAFSGALSPQSDESTASAGSFAFPTLPTEWNSKRIADARHMRKHRGWRLGLLCCKF